MTKKYNRYWLLYVALFITLLLTPLESVSIGGDTSYFSVVKLSVLFVFAIWGISGFPVDISKMLKVYIGLFAFFVITIPFSINIGHSINRLFLMLLPTILLCAILGGNVNTKERLVGILVAYLIGTLILSVFAYFNRNIILSNAVNEYGERVSALGHDENEMSYLLVLGVSCGLHLLRITKKVFVKALLILCVVAFSFFTIATASRTGMIILFVALMIFVFSNLKSRNGRVAVVLMVGVLLVASSYFLAFVPESTISRLFETREMISSGSLSGRGTIWRHGINAFFDGNVLSGAGYDNFMNRYAEYVGGSGMAAHNTYLSFLVCGGVIGFVLFLLLLVFIWKECKRVYKMTGDLFVFAYYIPLLITMLTLETTDRRWIYIIGILIYRWRVVLEEEKKTVQISSTK